MWLSSGDITWLCVGCLWHDHSILNFSGLQGCLFCNTVRDVRETVGNWRKWRKTEVEWVSRTNWELRPCARGWRPPSPTRVRAPIHAVSLWFLGRKFNFGTYPDFHLSESTLQNWLQLLCSGVGFLLLLEKGGLVWFWVLLAGHLKQGSKPSLGWAKKDLSSKVSNFLAMLHCVSQKELFTRGNSMSHVKNEVSGDLSVSWCVYWAKCRSAAFSV